MRHRGHCQIGCCDEPTQVQVGERARWVCGLIRVLCSIVGLMIKFIWWIIGAAALVGLFYLIRAIRRANARQRATLAQRMSELAARADQQHNWVMQGDDRGIYGPQGADLMHYIEQPGRAKDARQNNLGFRCRGGYGCDNDRHGGSRGLGGVEVHGAAPAPG